MSAVRSGTMLHRVVTVIVLTIFVAAPLAATAQAIPSAQILSRAVQEAYDKFKDVKDGANADYIPELAKVPSELFGVAIVTARGDVYTAGDVDYAFTIQSVSKPFTAALVMQEQGSANVIADKIGVEPTGLPFNSILATQILKPVSVNPLVNSGAIASVSLVKAKSAEERFGKIMDFFQRLAGDKLTVIDDVYKSEAATNQRNRAHAYILFVNDRIYSDAMEAVDVYTRQCSIGVTAKQLAVMGATLANSGGQSDHVLPGDRFPLRSESAGHHDDGRLLQRVGHVGVHGGLARQDRRGRRDRRRSAGQDGHRRLLPASERGRQQRALDEGDRVHQRSAGCECVRQRALSKCRRAIPMRQVFHRVAIGLAIPWTGCMCSAAKRIPEHSLEVR